MKKETEVTKVTEVKERSISTLFQGKMDKKFMVKRWLPISIFIFWSILCLSWIFYPSELNYNIFTHSISFLGDWTENPFPGWILFSIAIIFGGLSFLVMGMHIYRRMRVIDEKVSKLLNFFFIFGCFCIMAIGIFPDVKILLFGVIKLNDLHNTIAGIGFGGIGIGVAFYGLYVNVKDSIPRCGGKKQYSFWKFFLANNVLYIPGLLTGITMLAKEIQGYGFPGPGFLSFPFWEWMLLIGIWAYLVIYVIILPEKMDKYE